MKKNRKWAIAILAAVATLSFGLAIGCGGGKDDTPPASESGSTSDSSLSSDSTGGDTTPTNDCTDEKKGHEYSEKDGKCTRCGKEAVIPQLPADQYFDLVIPCEHNMSNCPDCDYTGSGEKENRVQLTEGCYTVKMRSNGELWLSFSVSQAGQYVLYSVDGAKTVKATRFNANDAYIPDEGIAAVVKGEGETDGNFFSYVNCGENYYNAAWRATYRLRGAIDEEIKVCFVRIGEPVWQPKRVSVTMHAEQINGVKAEDMPDDMQLLDVPYDSQYFYYAKENGGDGYYHLGTEDAVGEIIYAAIDKKAARLFHDNKFTAILKNANTALNLYAGTDEDENYVIRNYTPFIMNWIDENATWNTDRVDPDNPNSSGEPLGDPTKNCYQNFCNDDGVYPVTQELFEFLTLYLQNNSPADDTITSEIWQTHPDYLWLSACYYYQKIDVGTADNPKAFNVGTNDISVAARKFLYGTFAEEGRYILTVSDVNVKLIVNDQTYIPTADTPVRIVLDNNFATPTKFRMTHVNGEALTSSIHVEKVAAVELAVGKIPVTLQAGERAIYSGTLSANDYDLLWDTALTAQVTVNGTAATTGKALLTYTDVGEVAYVEIYNVGDEQITFELTVREHGLCEGENVVVLQGKEFLTCNIYGEEGETYAITSDFIVYSVVNDIELGETRGQAITSFTVESDGFVRVMVYLPQGVELTGSESFQATVTVTKVSNAE